MKVIVGLMIFAVLLVAPIPGKKCDCRAAASSETTRVGGNEWVVYREPAVHRRVQGVVRMPLDELQEDVLVEVFDNPDYLLCDWKPHNPNRCTMKPSGDQRRLAACRTGKNGEFCFDNLPAGSYELRVSKDQGWSPTHVYLAIDPKDSKSTNKPIEVPLQIGN